MRPIPWLPRALWLYCAGALIASGLWPHDRLTWCLEVVWVAAGLAVTTATWRRFPLTPLLCWLLFAHALILLVGAHYTYARVPPGEWVRDWLDLDRNHYDRLGHFAQGFVPAVLVREVLLRCSPLRPGRLLFVLVTACCLAFSALFELLEWGTWAAAVAMGRSADAYLGTQGDPWDAQWDMFLALVGAVLAQLALARWHDRQLEALAPPPPPPAPEKVHL